MSGFPNAQNNDAAAIPVRVTSGGGSGGGGAEAGVSLDNVAVGTSSAQVIAAATFKGWATIQNISATAIVYLSFNTPATTSAFTLQPGSAITLAFGPTNALYGIASAANAKIAAVGY
jgi:hypothetical protein